VSGHLHHFAPRNGWLVWLAQGWNLGNPYNLPVADFMSLPHGAYSVVLWREDGSETA
jgi:hypothetical protein